MRMAIALFVLFYVGIYYATAHPANPFFSPSDSQEDVEPPPCYVDVAFIMDSSGSMKETGFQQEKSFVKKAAKRLGVEPSKSQAAVIQFAETAKIKIKFKPTATLAEFMNAVDALEYSTEGSTTHIDKALEKAKEVFKGVSGERIKLLVVLTDGKQPGASTTLDRLSFELRNASVRVLAVGIGSGVNEEQLKVIAGDENFVVTAKDFTDLAMKLTLLMNKACACPVDVAFIVDASGSHEKAFSDAKEIVIGLTKNMSIGKTGDKSNAALMHFSASAKVDGLFGTYATEGKFQRAVNGLPFLGKQTRIDRALELASQKVFEKSSSNRPQIAIILTDGIQRPDSQEVPKGLIAASRPLRKKGVRVIAVGITSQTSERRLRMMTQRDADVVVGKKNDVINKVKLLLKNACKPLPTQMPAPNEFCEDIRNDCAVLAKKNHCNSHPDSMAEDCPQTCNLCPPTY